MTYNKITMPESSPAAGPYLPQQPPPLAAQPTQILSVPTTSNNNATTTATSEQVVAKIHTRNGQGTSCCITITPIPIPTSIINTSYAVYLPA